MILKKITPILFLAISIASCSILKAQNSVNLSLHQDMKLLIWGDELGNRAGTLNYNFRLKHETQDKKYGYFMYGLEFEQALLDDIYTRFGAFGGFSFMEVLDDYNFHVTPSIGAGIINRTGKNLFSLSAGLQFEYFLGDRFRLSVLNQITQRTDLEYLYDDLKYRYSFFIGFEYTLFELKRKRRP